MLKKITEKIKFFLWGQLNPIMFREECDNSDFVHVFLGEQSVRRWIENRFGYLETEITLEKAYEGIEVYEDGIKTVMAWSLKNSRGGFYLSC